MNKYNRTIEGKIRRSNNMGNIVELFELYKNFLDGIDVEQDEKQANVYLNKLKSIYLRENSHIKLTKLSLKDFRCFCNTDINLDPKLVVFIGNNGTGKTSILESIAKVLKWLTASIIKEKNSAGAYIIDDDIEVNSKNYAEIAVTFDFLNKEKINVELRKSIKGSPSKNESRLVELRNLSDIYRVLNAKEQIQLPLFLYYSIERSRKSVIRKKQVSTIGGMIRNSRFDAYNNALDGEEKITTFLKKFIELENKRLAVKKDIREELLFENLMDKIKDKNSEEINKTLRSFYEELSFKNVSSENKDCLNEIKKIIKEVVPEITDIFLDLSSGSSIIKVVIDDKEINIRQLSHGQINLICLVGDITYRMCLLNNCVLDDFTKTQGIILIDELELHLHPSWQKTILGKLQKSFSNIQFIVTTHSPQILSSVNKDYIYVSKSNGKVEKLDYQTIALDIDSILGIVMNTQPIDEEIEEFKKLNLYIKSIENGTYAQVEAKELWNDLLNIYGEDHLRINECKAMLARRIFVEELKKKGNT